MVPPCRRGSVRESNRNGALEDVDLASPRDRVEDRIQGLLVKRLRLQGGGVDELRQKEAAALLAEAGISRLRLKRR